METMNERELALMQLNTIGIVEAVIKCKAGELDPNLLRIPMWGTDIDEPEAGSQLADESCTQFRSYEDEPNVYFVTLLGFINGVLPELTGKVLSMNTDDETGEIVGWDIKDKWWK